MKKLLVSVMMLWAGVAWGEELKCKDCPKDDPCAYYIPAGDSCNYCTCHTYCVDDKWYTLQTACTCTLLGCIRPDKEISNPFKKETP